MHSVDARISFETKDRSKNVRLPDGNSLNGNRLQEVSAGRFPLRRDDAGALHPEGEEVRRLPGLPERPRRGEMRQLEAGLQIGPIQV